MSRPTSSAIRSALVLRSAPVAGHVVARPNDLAIRGFATSNRSRFAASLPPMAVFDFRREIPSRHAAHAGPFPWQQKRTMFIQTESTPNDNSLKFIPGIPVSTSGTHEFLDVRSALSSPLATRLLTVDGLTAVLFGPDFVTCSVDEPSQWSILKPEIFAVLMEHFSSGLPLFKDGQGEDGAEDTRILDSDSEVVGMIKELLDTRVRPAIQEDGGDIEYRGFEEGVGMVKLKLKGSCRGCSSSSATLKNGIERMLMHYVPEVKGVEQVLDEEELISLNEFAKLEARLEKKTQEDKKAESVGVSLFTMIKRKTRELILGTTV